MRTRAGFTFVELMMVAAIIAILAAIAVPNFLEAQVRATVARSTADQAVLRSALNAYHVDYRAWPPNAVPGVASARDLLAVTTPIAYIGRVPYDPFTQPEARGRRLAQGRQAAEWFRYYNAVQVAPERGLSWTAQDSWMQYLVECLLIGHGPSYTANGTPRDAYTTLTPTGEAKLLNYDATNGTVSAGDIYTTLP